MTMYSEPSSSARHSPRLASFAEAFQALADFVDFANALAMRDVVRAAVRG